MKGYVFDIQRFSVHDGPGIRTTVFLKGCSLHCFWCQNPEGIRLKPEILFYSDKCIRCGHCVVACLQGAHIMKEGVHVYLREKCVTCGKCTETCYSGALILAGKQMTVDEVIEEVLRDRIFYEISNGGVTLSGGDPVVQHDFSTRILERCKAEGLHTAIETAANCPWKVLANLLPLTELIMMDVKHLNPHRHREVTGVSNKTILENAKRLAQTSKPVIIRTPIIPTVNDTLQEIGAIAKFLQSFSNLQYLELLPFHHLGKGKYFRLGLDYRANHLKTPTKEKMRELALESRKFGISVRVD